jgi:hypothetical protein
MATSAVPVPTSNGRTHTANAPTDATVNDTNHSKFIIKFNASTENRKHYTWVLPNNYFSGNVILRLKWRANATTGDCVWKSEYFFYPTANSTVPAGGGANTATTTTTTGGTANLVNETTITLSSGIAASRFLVFTIVRDAGAGGDTLAVDAELLEFFIEYTCDASITRHAVWIPANAWTNRSGSGASLVGFETGSSTSDHLVPYAYDFPDVAGCRVDYKFNLPSTYAGNLKYSVIDCPQSSGSQHTWIASFKNIAVGGATDPSLTADSAISATVSAGTFNFVPTTLRAVPITPAAGDEINIVLARDETDANNGIVSFMGMWLEYDISLASPAPIRMDPSTGVAPGSSAATLLQANDTNHSKWVVEYADGSTQQYDFEGGLPGIYGSGGTLRVTWRTPASGTPNARFNAQVYSPATGSASDGTLVATASVNVASAGANLRNEFTLDVSSALAALDLLNLRLVREGGHASDTVSDKVQVLEVVLEVNVVA